MRFCPPTRNRFRGLAACLAFASCALHGQSAPPTLTIRSVVAPANVIRAIDDPSSGARWVLVRDLANRGGPGKLVLVGTESFSARDRGVSAQIPSPESLTPVIRVGDRVILDLHTASADGRLEAIALNPARLGASVEVRIRIGGRIVRALAAGPGRAVLEAGQ